MKIDKIYQIIGPYLFILFVALLVGIKPVQADEYRAIFWNLHSGDSDPEWLANQMVQKGPIDFWGFSEVANQAALDIFETALETANPTIDYIAKLSEEGRGDRLAILYRSDRFQAVTYSGDALIDEIGNHFFEVDSINVGGTIRPALGIQLEFQQQPIVMLVNHWKCCGECDDLERRAKQAIAMNAFARQTPGIPIFSGGDFNIPLNTEGKSRVAFLVLNEIWSYLEPAQADTVGTFREDGTVFDAVFVTQDPSAWRSYTQILTRRGNNLAVRREFNDNQFSTDHRPLVLVVSLPA